MDSSKSIVLITGANNGIGFDFATLLAKSSAKYHILLGSRSVTKGQHALAELHASSPLSTVTLVELDVTSAASIQAAVSTITEQHGRLDVLVNNAGISSSASSLIAQLRDTFETNAFGPAVLTEALAPLLQKSRDPRIIFVTSELGSISRRTDRSNAYDGIDALAYRMSKAALNMLAMSHAKYSEAWEKPAKVWCYDPGFTVTDLTGVDERETRKRLGARQSKEAAAGMVPIVEGWRDDDDGKMVNDREVFAW